MNCRSGSIANARKYPDGAAIGFLSYELARHLEPLPLADSSFTCPMFPLPTTPESSASSVEQSCAPRPQDAVRVHSPVDFKMYCRAVEKIRSYIAAGTFTRRT